MKRIIKSENLNLDYYFFTINSKEDSKSNDIKNLLQILLTKELELKEGKLLKINILKNNKILVYFVLNNIDNISEKYWTDLIKENLKNNNLNNEIEILKLTNSK